MDLYLRSDGVGIKNVETWEKKLLLDSVIPQNTLNNQGFFIAQVSEKMEKYHLPKKKWKKHESQQVKKCMNLYHPSSRFYNSINPL